MSEDATQYEKNTRRRAIRDLMEGGVRFGTSGVRGRIVDMTEDVCFAYASAFLQTVSSECGRVALARDLRPSSPAIASACAAAIRHAGLTVDHCGAIPTPALAWYAQTKRLPAIMVTGSHIPFDRNGIKFYNTSGEITKADEAAITRAVVDLPPGALTDELPPVNPEAREGYLDRYLRFFPQKSLAGMTLGVYQHSSVARDLLSDLLQAMGANVIALGRTDGFVPIDTEAVSDADAARARDWASRYGFDAVVSTDGDADRPLIGDERGQWLRGDLVGILCAQYLGARSVVTTVNCNTAAEQCGAFAEVIRTRIGSPFVIEAMQARIDAGIAAVVGFEPNGGFLVGTPIMRDGRELGPLLTRDAALPILCLLSMARERNVPLSDLARHLPARFTASDRIQDFPSESSGPLLAALTASAEDRTALVGGLCGPLERIDQTDGLRMIFAGGDILHFRPSGNAPELRCYAEAGTPERAAELVRDALRRFCRLAGRTTGSSAP